MSIDLQYDYVLVGGGLQAALIALALAERRPTARVALVERAESLGGNHLWSFHAGDLSREAERFVAPLVVRQWPAYDVVFPRLERRIDDPYCSISSERLDEVVRAAFAERSAWDLYLGVEATEVESQLVRLADGRVIEGALVIDARGPGAFALPSFCAYQKFVGVEVELAEDSPRTEPMLMDARVEQFDGFRFVYVLPFQPRRVLLEDTYFSDRPELVVDSSRERLRAYAAHRGYRVARVLREETGVLPLPARMPPKPEREGPLRAGYGGGWFHPTTGYSFPVATRLAEHVARHDLGAVRGPAWTSLVSEHRRQLRFAVFLNQLLFGAFPPERRWNVLERFYRLPAGTIRRFYALCTTTTDRARTLCGKPPRGLSLGFALSRGLS